LQSREIPLTDQDDNTTRSDTSGHTERQTLKEACPDGKILILAFHDDLTIIGKPQEVAMAFNAFKQEVKRVDLDAQPAKSAYVDFHFNKRDEAAHRQECAAAAKNSNKK